MKAMYRAVTKRLASRSSQGQVHFVLLLVSAPLFILAAIAATLSMPSSVLSAADEPGVDDIRYALVSAGISPENLAAAGVSADAAATVVSQGKAYLLGENPALPVRTVAVFEARQRMHALERSIRSQTADVTLADVEAARQVVSEAEARLAADQQSIRQAAFANLTDTQRAALSRLRDSSHMRELPMVYRVLDGYGEAETHSLRDALAAVRTAEHAGVEVDPEAVAVVAAADARPEVQTAAAGLESLQFIESRYETELHDE